jgi:hypothetical protein
MIKNETQLKKVIKNLLLTEGIFLSDVGRNTKSGLTKNDVSENIIDASDEEILISGDLNINNMFKMIDNLYNFVNRQSNINNCKWITIQPYSTDTCNKKYINDNLKLYDVLVVCLNLEKNWDKWRLGVQNVDEGEGLWNIYNEYGKPKGNGWDSFWNWVFEDLIECGKADNRYNVLKGVNTYSISDFISGYSDIKNKLKALTSNSKPNPEVTKLLERVKYLKKMIEILTALDAGKDYIIDKKTGEKMQIKNKEKIDQYIQNKNGDYEMVKDNFTDELLKVLEKIKNYDNLSSKISRGVDNLINMFSNN